MKQNRRAILNRIRTAQDEHEIENLLYEGRGFEHASDRTRKSWKRAADKRRKELAT